MRKIFALVLCICLLAMSAVPAFAENGKVTYAGKAKGIILAPGSDDSLTDLFPNFKDVMPGDTISQKITVRNDASNEVKVKIYMRALGAHPDSVEFLSQLRLGVQKSGENTYMFDAAAHETAQLTDWVCLGTLYSGGQVDLDVFLSVPVELDNRFQKMVGYLDWEFMIEEFPIEDTDPQPPKTGDEFPVTLVVALMAGSAVAIVLLLLPGKKKKQQESQGN